MTHRFFTVEVDVDAREVRLDNELRSVEPQVFDVLLHLIDHRDRVVTKEELLDEVWGSRFVSESALTSRIKSARQAVGDSGRAQTVIRTVHGRGYRFVAPLASEEAATPTPAPTGSMAATPISPFGPAPEPIDDGWGLVGRDTEMAEMVRVAATGERAGVILTGPAGMGKTALARALADHAIGSGWSTATISGHAEARDVPLAGLAHLLPSDIVDISGLDGDLARTALFHRARSAIGVLAAGQRLMMIVDDVDRVDSLSLALIGSLLSAGTVFAVMTQRTEPSSDVAFDHLVRSGDLVRIEIEPIDDTVLGALLESALGGPVRTNTRTTLVGSAAGNPGVLRQLVESSRDGGVLVRGTSGWILEGPVVATPDLAQLIDDRLEQLDDEHRHAAELIAIAGNLELDVAFELVADEVLDALELHGMVALHGNELRLAHPLFAEVLNEQLPPLRSRRHRATLADALEHRPDIRPTDRLKVVQWRIESGGEVTEALVLDAVRLALIEEDTTTASRLLSHVDDAISSSQSTQLRAEVLFLEGQFSEAGELLRSIDRDGLELETAAFIVRRIATSLFYGDWDEAGAMQFLADHTDTYSGDTKATIDAYWVMLAALDGRRASEALARGEELLSTSSGFTRLEVLCGIGMARFVLGRLDAAIEAIDEFHRELAGLPASLTWAGPDYAQFVEVMTQFERGDVTAAELALKTAIGDAPSPPLGFLSIAAGRHMLRTGHPQVALDWLDPLVELAEAIDLKTNLLPMQATTARAALAVGDTDRARREADRLRALIGDGATFMKLDMLESVLRVDAALGDRAAAARDFIAAAERAADTGNTIMEASLLGAAVETGAAADALPRLVELAAEIGGGLIDLKVRHAFAVVEGSEPLDSVADAYQSAGVHLTAAAIRAELAG